LDDVWLIEQPLAVAYPELHAMVQQTKIIMPSVLLGQGILKRMGAMGQINAIRADHRIEGPSFLSVSSCSFFMEHMWLLTCFHSNTKASLEFREFLGLCH
jgi:hypothetical protein